MDNCGKIYGPEIFKALDLLESFPILWNLYLEKIFGVPELLVDKFTI
jgi:hypothetical protein